MNIEKAERPANIICIFLFLLCMASIKSHMIKRGNMTINISVSKKPGTVLTA
jgi:hypothetical protein